MGCEQRSAFSASVLAFSDSFRPLRYLSSALSVFIWPFSGHIWTLNQTLDSLLIFGSKLFRFSTLIWPCRSLSGLFGLYSTFSGQNEWDASKDPPLWLLFWPFRHPFGLVGFCSASIRPFQLLFGRIIRPDIRLSANFWTIASGMRVKTHYFGSYFGPVGLFGIYSVFFRPLFDLFQLLFGLLLRQTLDSLVIFGPK